MSDQTKEQKAGLAISYLRAKCSVDGVAVLSLDNGQMFMFSRATIENLKRQLDEKGSDEALIFVERSGQTLRST